jgi:hypothetical protein
MPMHGPIWPLLPAETRHMCAFRCDKDAKESPTPLITYDDLHKAGMWRPWQTEPWTGWQQVKIRVREMH